MMIFIKISYAISFTWKLTCAFHIAISYLMPYVIFIEKTVWNDVAEHSFKAVLNYITYKNIISWKHYLNMTIFLYNQILYLYSIFSHCLHEKVSISINSSLLPFPSPSFLFFHSVSILFFFSDFRSFNSLLDNVFIVFIPKIIIFKMFL